MRNFIKRVCPSHTTIAPLRRHPARQTQRGFSFIELLVGLGLFSLLVLLVTSALFYMVSFQRTIESRQQILNDFRTTLDIMVKEMTTGSAFPSGCSNGCTDIIFVTKPRPDMPRRNIHYRYNSVLERIEKAEQKTYGVCSSIPFNTSCFQPFHSDKVRIESVTYYVQNKGTYTQPSITIQIEGDILTGAATSDFQITSTVTSRHPQDVTTLPPTESTPPTITITGPTSLSSYTTGSATIVLSGLANDASGTVTGVRWRNTGNSLAGVAGSTNSYSSWTSGPIPLVSGANIIIVEAIDASENTRTDTITVTTTF